LEVDSVGPFTFLTSPEQLRRVLADARRNGFVISDRQRRPCSNTVRTRRATCWWASR
jgi:DNA-binding IclR family transcriptional regulator